MDDSFGMKIRKKIKIALQALLIMYAFFFEYTEPLQVQDFKSSIHYLFAQCMDILGEYHIEQLFLFCMSVILILWVNKSEYRKTNPGKLLPAFFSACLMIGRCMAGPGSLDGIFGNPFSLIKSLLAFCGYALLLYYLLAVALGLFEKAGTSQWKPAKLGKVLGDNGFLPVWGLLLLVWSPIVLLSYPANLCYDGLGGIAQGVGEIAYTSHHPLLHTLFMSSLVKLGKLITGSYNAGAFVYIVLQALMLSAALAGTIVRLARRQASYSFRFFALAIYLLSPMYSNMVSTLLKDIPFMAAFIWYLLLLEECVHRGLDTLSPRDMVKLTLVSALVGLLRKNGLYVVVLTAVVIVIVWGKRLKAKKVFIMFAMIAVLPLLLCKGGDELMIRSLHANRGSVAEMMSIPFQQTARYLQLYRGELSPAEREGIETVLGDVDKIALRYDPLSADAIKALYVTTSGFEELTDYMKAWFMGLCKHPGVYVDAFLIHVYGWFDPGVINSIRYEAESEMFPRTGPLRNMDKILVFWYRGLSHIPFIEILENVGIYTWCLFLLASVSRRKKDGRGILLVPLFISLLICMASPCFFLHPRYAYPIMFTVPFLIGLLGTRSKENGEEKV